MNPLSQERFSIHTLKVQTPLTPEHFEYLIDQSLTSARQGRRVDLYIAETTLAPRNEYECTHKSLAQLLACENASLSLSVGPFIQEINPPSSLLEHVRSARHANIYVRQSYGTAFFRMLYIDNAPVLMQHSKLDVTLQPCCITTLSSTEYYWPLHPDEPRAIPAILRYTFNDWAQSLLTTFITLYASPTCTWPRDRTPPLASQDEILNKYRAQGSAPLAASPPPLVQTTTPIPLTPSTPKLKPQQLAWWERLFWG